MAKSAIMKKNLLAALLCLSAVLVFNVTGNAQGTLLHYWNFNSYNTTPPYAYPNFPAPFNADYSRIDPTKASVVFTKYPGISALYHNSSSVNILDFAAAVTSDYDTVNLRLGTPAGYYMRPRNPMDSMYLLFYIPTTNYKNILVSYGTQSSSFASGDQYQYFDYSTDSGTTWTTTGLSKLFDSALLTFKRISVAITDPAANNNPKLVFRIHFVGRNTGTSGNNRFDNISVDADTLVAPVTIHYWSFNTYTTTYTYPHTFPLGSINADFSLIDPTQARIYLGTFSGTSPTWHSAMTTLMDANASDGNVNAHFGAPAGTSIRPRNPLDSAYLYYYIPTTGYHDIVVSYASESSSTGSGDGEQWFDYSKDSGVTWNTALLSEPFDSAWPTFKLISVNFTSDSGVNNNPKLVFRIHFVNHTTGISGNNRFDNVSVDGVPYPVYNTIATTAATYGPFCNAAANPISVAFTSAGTYTGAWSVQLSNPGGTFPANTTANIIGTGATSPISVSIPAGTAVGNYRVRVVNTNPAILSSNDNGTNIVMNAPPTAYNVTGSAAYCAGGTGAAVGLSGSQTGVRYKLYLDGTYLNDSLNGTTGILSFGNMTTGGTYTATAFNVATPTCTTNMTGSAIVTVNPLPAAITGTTTTCQGITVTLADATSGGSWSSSFTTAATIDPASGILTAVIPGLSTITYALPTGCTTTTSVSINGPVPNIDGTMNVCTGLTTYLSVASGIGTWSSANTSIATIDAFGGIAGGVSAGTATVSYTNDLGCVRTATVTINQAPSVITGFSNVCAGSTITLADDITGGTWSSSDGTAGIGVNSGVVTGNSPGTPNITYVLPTGCNTVAGIVVNAVPDAITATAVVCAGSTATLTEGAGSGNWSSSDDALATVDASGIVSGVSAGAPAITFAFGTGCQVTTVVTINPLPAGITGLNNICEGVNITLNEPTTGGVWTSSNTTSVVIDPSTGFVNGIVAGSATITYTLPTTCMITTDINVKPLPSAIIGNTNACVGQASLLSNITSDGTWSSSSSSVSVDATSGSITGVAPGTSMITYRLSTGCKTTAVVSVNPLASITGLSFICSGLGATLADVVTGGAWSSDNTSAVSIDPATGVYTTTAPGVANVTYSLPYGCSATSAITVALSPDDIAGTPNVCRGTTTTLTDPGFGSWSSSNTAVATVGTSSGVVAGALGGTATISYTLGSGCFTHTVVTVNVPPAAISGNSAVCQGSSTLYTDATTAGTWSSTAGTGVATIDASGFAAGLVPGNAVISYTSVNGCSITKTITINPAPTAITGTPYVCAASTTALGDATIGGTWTSSNAALATINVTTGSLKGLTAGTPTITYHLPTGCFATVVATVTPLPTVYLVTGGGSYCAGSGGLHVGLSGSQTGINYQLFYGVTHVGGPVAGTGSALDFGAQALAEVYTVVANDGTTSCVSPMAGTAPVVTNALPFVYNVTGGGHYCASGAGVHIGLDGSNTGISYQLYNAGLPMGSSVPGVSGPLDLGSASVAGAYNVLATNMATACTFTMTSTATVVADPAVTPSVSLATGIGDVVCGGSLVHIAATTVNGGLTPTYSWTKNGIPIVVSGGTYTYLPADGDNIVVTLTSSASCASPVVTGSSLSLHVLPHGAPAVSISSTPGTAVCQGTSVTYLAAPSYAGSAPTLTWVVNNLIMGIGTSFSYTPANGDAVKFILGSNYQCRTADSGTSNTINMIVDAPATPTVSITVSPNNTISSGETVALTAHVTGGSSTLHYQWFVNGVIVPGAVYSTFSGSNFNDNDSVSCVVVSNGICAGLTGSSFSKIHISHVGVQQVTSAGSDISLVPNPNRGVFTVKGILATAGDEEVALQVTNMLGQAVYTISVMAANGKIDQQIILNGNLANGMYLLNVRLGGQNNLFHFVVEK